MITKKQEDKMIELRKAGKTIYEIAKAVGCSPATVHNKTKGEPGKYKRIPKEQVNEIIKLCGKGEKVSKIAEIVGCKESAVYSVRRKIPNKYYEELKEAAEVTLPKEEPSGVEICELGLIETPLTQASPKHYDNSKGSLYKFAEQQGLNPWEFDAVKRIVRSRKKGSFEEDIRKTSFLLELYLKEYANIDTEREKELGSIFQKVREFNESFNVAYNTKPTFDIADKTLRHNLMQEENNEYLDATNIVEVADALGDQLYILVGTILKHGLQNVIVDVFNEIHGSNMSKLQDGKPIYREDGKILKGDKYYKPNLEKFF